MSGCPFGGSSAAALREVDALPGPRGLPILGNLHQIDLVRMHAILEAWCEQFGDCYRLRLGNRTGLAIADAQLTQAALRARPGTFRRIGSIEPVFREMRIHGVFSAEGDEWLRQRRLVMKAFDPGHLKQFFPTLQTVTERLARRWAGGGTVDALGDLTRYTVDVTSSLAFGYALNTLEERGEVIQQHLERIFPAVNRRVNALFPYWRYFRLPSDRELDRTLATVHAAIETFIADARSRMAADPQRFVQPTNLLEAMIAAERDEPETFESADLVGNVFTLLLAGEDTTASTIAWALWYLATRPAVVARIRTELDAAGAGDFSALQKLTFLEAVANETMRLKPVAPLLFMQAREDTQLGSVRVPKGTPVFLIIRPAAMRAADFPDATEFRPERWLPGDAAAPTDAGRRAVMPFGAGPRFCPGRYLALLEIKMVLAMVAREFEIGIPAAAPAVTERFGFTMAPADLRIELRPRARVTRP